jgi:hypothetical protein
LDRINRIKKEAVNSIHKSFGFLNPINLDEVPEFIEGLIL